MPVDHVRREHMPWRAPLDRTECGRALSNVPGRVLSRAEWHTVAREWNDLVRSYRVAKMQVPASAVRPNVCMTCWTTCERWPAWERVPLRPLWRWLDDFGYYPAGRDAEQACRELWAIGHLVRRHRREFDALIESMPDGYRRDDL
jgi:hypothetical protein